MSRKRIAFYLVVAITILYSLWTPMIMVLEAFEADIATFFAPPGTVRFVGDIPHFSGGFHPTLIRFIDAFSLQHFPRLALNSTVIGLLSTGLALVVGTPAAYSLARFDLKGKGLFELAILALRTVSPFAIVIPFFIVYSRTGFWDTHLGLSLTYLVITIPVGVWILTSIFRDIPKEIYEAASMTGASEFRVFWRVALPLAIPGLIATAVFAFVLVWNEFLFASILTGADAKTVSVAVWAGLGETPSGFRIIEFEAQTAAATLAFIPAVAIIILIRRYMTRMLTFGVASRE